MRSRTAGDGIDPSGAKRLSSGFSTLTDETGKWAPPPLVCVPAVIEVICPAHLGLLDGVHKMDPSRSGGHSSAIVPATAWFDFKLDAIMCIFLEFVKLSHLR